MIKGVIKVKKAICVLLGMMIITTSCANSKITNKSTSAINQISNGAKLDKTSENLTPTPNLIIQYFSKNDFKTAKEMAIEYLKTDSDNPSVNNILGTILVKEEDYNNALPYLEKSIQSPSVPLYLKTDSLVNLAICHYVTGNQKKAKEELLEAQSATTIVKTNALSTELLTTLNLTSYFDDWNTIESEHFIFHFHPSFDDEKRKLFVERHEDAFPKVNEFFNSNLPKKIDFYIWDSDESAKKILGQSLGFTLSRYSLINSRYNQTIEHEMTHAISRWMYPTVKTTSFINEGLATYFTKFSSKEYILEKVSNIQSDFKSGKLKNLSVKELWQNNEAFRTVYSQDVSYIIGCAFVGNLLNKGGVDKFKELLKDQSYENAQKIYGDQLDQIIKNFENKFN